MQFVKYYHLLLQNYYHATFIRVLFHFHIHIQYNITSLYLVDFVYFHVGFRGAVTQSFGGVFSWQMYGSADAIDEMGRSYTVSSSQ
jgi:hypothetical protein